MTAFDMADLNSLIRLRKHEVDEKQKVLADIYRQVEVLETKKSELLARLERERKALDDNLTLETRDFYGRFENAVRNDVERIDVEIKNLEVHLEKAQEEVRVAFAEQKRIEIVNERRKEEEADEITNKESRELDEIGIEGFRRKEKP